MSDPRRTPDGRSAASTQANGVRPAPLLRRRAQLDPALAFGPTAASVIAALERVLRERKSEALLLWPQRPDSVAIFHALASLARLETCDDDGLTTLFFPWNRSTAGSQRTLLVDKDFLDRAVLGPLNRMVASRVKHPAYSYLMALHSLRHVMSSGKKNVWLKRAVRADPGLFHPSLFEITPQCGVSAGGVYSYDDQFLRRLRRHTWISDCKDHLEAATTAGRTPFFLFGVHADAPTVKSIRAVGLDPKRGGRIPDVVLVDLTRSARERMEHWRRVFPGFLGVLSDLYAVKGPPVLAITDDPFVLQGLRWEVLKRYDVRRTADAGDKKPSRASGVLSANPDPLEGQCIDGSATAAIHIEAYGSDVLSLVEAGLKLRKAFVNAGDQENADAVTHAISVAQSLVGLPGSSAQLYEFLGAQYEGHEKQTLGSRFDHQAPIGKMRAALQRGLAGPQHSALSKFLNSFEALCRATEASSSSCRLFNESLRRLVETAGRAMVVCSSEFVCGFIVWRLENDAELSGVRSHLGDKLVIADRREAVERLNHRASAQFDRVFFVEPQTDDLLHVLVTQSRPLEAFVLLNLARAEQTLRRVRILLDLPGIESVKPVLSSVQTELERVLQGRVSEIPDLEAEIPLPRLGTLDLTGGGAPAIGARRVLSTSSGLRIRAFDGSEIAIYDPDAVQVFSRKLAKDLEPGDRICVFSPDFVAMAREKLNLTRDAPEVLALYHNNVVRAVQKLAGKDTAAKIVTLRAKMRQIDPALDLPGDQAMRYWIDIEHLPSMARDKVTPHAPRDREHFLCFMRALGVTEDIARHYWDLGIFWTRSLRIRSGASFHQVFMAILIDPHGTASWLPADRRQEVWRILETAEQHVVTVVTNKAEAKP